MVGLLSFGWFGSMDRFSVLEIKAEGKDFWLVQSVLVGWLSMTSKVGARDHPIHLGRKFGKV